MNYIKQYKNNLSKNFCQNIIKKFESDKNKTKGITGMGYNPNIKQSIDLHISTCSGWEKEDEHLFESLKDPIASYIDEFYLEICKGILLSPFDSGYQIQKTTVDDIGYVWHNDFFAENRDTNKVATRIATYIWYLNDIEEGGETEFIDGTKVLPETGKLIIFPSTWTYSHQGHPPKSGNKYICTGWYYSYL